MIKCLIADDEAYFRKYMEHVIDWASEGMEICAFCKNADEVLAFVQDHPVDVVFMDINMPGQDGLSLSAQLKTRFPSMLLVFITGYSEFEYAKRALQIGAEDYLLKPFSAEELLVVTAKLKAKREMQQTQYHRERKASRIARESLLRDWVHSDNEEEAEEQLKNLEEQSVVFPRRYYLAAIIETDEIAVMRQQQRDVSLWKFIIMNIGSEILEKLPGECYLFEDYEDQITVIFNTDQKTGKDDMREYIQTLQKMLGPMGDCTVSVGLGDWVDDGKKIAETYDYARIALRNKFMMGTGEILFYDEYQNTSQMNFDIGGMSEGLLNALRRHNETELNRCFDLVEEKMKDSRYNGDFLFGILSSMMSDCLSYLTEMHADISKVYGNDFKPYQSLYACSSLNLAVQYVHIVYKKAYQALSRKVSHRAQEIIDAVMEYIAQHYQDEDLSSESIAEGVYLDSSYVRRTISKQLGCSVTFLLTEYRMEKACSLLTKERLSVGDAAERVGYSDPGYFSKCFRKFYGISPSEYAGHYQG